LDQPTTQNADYAHRLARIEGGWWRRWIDPQIPYRYNLRRLRPGFTLDIGAGIGRNLLHLDGNGIGLDHNEEGVRLMRSRGLRAFNPAGFLQSGFAQPGLFDSLLFAHVLEHMTRDQARALVQTHLPYLKKGGRVIVVTPQEAGYQSDATHVTFLDSDATSQVLRALGLKIEKAYSFPFPRFFGKFFTHNEFVVVGRA
jgi:SAM-dependent methyltransferase